jgi:hypothetical protein
LNKPANALYYHVDKLLEVELLEVDGSRAATTRHETVYRPTIDGYNFRDGAEHQDGRETIIRAFRAKIRAAERDFRHLNSESSDHFSYILVERFLLENKAAHEDFVKKLQEQLEERMKSSDFGNSDSDDRPTRLCVTISIIPERD